MFHRAKNAIREKLWRLNDRLTGSAYTRLEERLSRIEQQMDEMRSENQLIISLLGRMHDREQTDRLSRSAANKTMPSDQKAERR